jgi:signal transduction histidine kinase
MLDIRTLYITLSLLVLVMGVAWLLVWRAQPRLPGLALWALGSLLTGVATGLLAMRGLITGWLSVVLANVLIVYSQGLLQYAIADLAGRPRLRWLVLGATIITIITWPYFWLVMPGNIGIRYAINNGFVGLIFVGLAWTVWSSPNLPRLQVMPFAAMASIHALSSFYRAGDGLLNPVQDFLAPGLGQAVLTLEAVLSAIGCTVGFAVLLGARLTRDLEQQNEALTEVIGTQRVLQVQLRTALTQEAAMRREQQHFISRISAQFDVPLQAISCRIEQLRQLPPALHESIAARLDAITGAARRLRLLIDTFLLDRRIQGGMAEMRQDRVDLSALLADLLREQARPGARPGAEWRLQFNAPAQAVTARGDAAMLAVVFGNLVDNALKYSAADAPVAVTLERNDEEAVVTVEDRGIGIPARDLGAIGRRFFRATNAANVPGTGLGLFSAGRLIQFHGGRFLVDSAPDRGTRITVHLPLHGAA